jgi:hypothetical protein
MAINFPKTEEDILKFWQEIEAFQTQLRLTEGCPHFTFYDGPPFGRLETSPDSLSGARLTLFYFQRLVHKPQLPRQPYLLADGD